jgi:murein DD-endopeptidase MepM/ murein hydrolase activator NlpD
MAALASLSSVAEAGHVLSAGPQRTPADAAASAAGPAFGSPCPPGTLPDNGVCIPVPSQLGGAALAAEHGAHRERSGAWRIYDQIPRRPDRPADYRRYRLPVPPLPGQNLVVSGYDLDRPDEEQRRGAHIHAIGHGGIDLAQKRGTEIHLVNLEHQVGDAEVLVVGEVFGNSVVTRQSVREGGRLREYIVLFGHLEGPAPGLHPGMNLREGSLVGFVGDSGAPGNVHLHLEIRRVREGVNVKALASGELTKNERTVVCDPRNVLPLVSQ